MKKTAAAASLFAVFLTAACSENDGFDGYSYSEPTIYSPSNKPVFSEIILFLQPYIMDGGTKKYVLTDTLRSIAVSINDKMQRIATSYGMDTLHVRNKSTVGSCRVTTDSIAYPVQVNVLMFPEKFSTAGEYANLLNSYFELSPGAYICRIQSFSVGSQTAYTPALSFPLEVAENRTSVSVGKFEVEVSPTN
ncbi:MAG: hypothetical protein LBO71_03885 [Prevotellaceae bacterium]|jgi:hypothetical protein|nr:hypothetical protein [Prevotellaceae bacterium]